MPCQQGNTSVRIASTGAVFQIAPIGHPIFANWQQSDDGDPSSTATSQQRIIIGMTYNLIFQYCLLRIGHFVVISITLFCFSFLTNQSVRTPSGSCGQFFVIAQYVLWNIAHTEHLVQASKRL